MNVVVRRPRNAPAPAAVEGPPGVESAVKSRRPDRRSAKTIDKIVNAAISLMLTHGMSKVSARQVCEQAGVSRGTLYRYFASMEDLLQAVAMRLRTETDEELREAMEGLDDPAARFAAFIKYTAGNGETARASSFLQVEPAFVLRYFESNFDHFIARVNSALEPVFDAWEAELGEPVDRDAVSEMMVRYALSLTLLPTRPGQTPLPARLLSMAQMVLSKKD